MEQEREQILCSDTRKHHLREGKDAFITEKTLLFSSWVYTVLSPQINLLENYICVYFNGPGDEAAAFSAAYADLATEEGFYPEGPATTTGWSLCPPSLGGIALGWIQVDPDHFVRV